MSEIQPETIEAPEGVVEDGAAAAPEADAWAGPSQEEYEQLTNDHAQLREWAESQRQAQEGNEPDEQIPDPYTEPAEFKAWLQQQVDERNAPYADFVDNANHSEAHQRGLDILSDNEAQHGEFLGKSTEETKLEVDSTTVAYQLAEMFLPEAEQRHGQGPKAAEAALARGADVVRQPEQAIAARHAAQQSNRMGTLSGAPRQPAASGTGGPATVVIPEGGDEKSVVAKYLGGNGLTS